MPHERRTPTRVACCSDYHTGALPFLWFCGRVDLRQFLRRPCAGVVACLLADLRDHLRINRAGGVFPTAAGVGEHVGDVLVAERAEGGHLELETKRVNFDGA